jgi:hypothetical protein
MQIISKPLIYLLIFLISFEGVFNFYKIGGLSFVRLIELIYFIFLFKVFLESYRNIALKKFYIMFFAFLITSFLRIFSVTFIQNDLDTYLFKTIFNILFLVLYLFLNYYIINKNFNYIKIILFINFFIVLIAFFQSSLTPLTDLAWEIKYQYFGLNSIGFEDSNTFRKRVIGLYPFSIPLAYVLVTNMILTVYLYLKEKNNIYLLYFLFLGIVSVFTLTRSIIISWLILTIYVSYINIFKFNLFKKILFITIISLTLSYGINKYIENADSLDRITKTDGASAEGRLPLAITGIYAVLKYPLGISEYNYNQVKKEMFYEFQNTSILKYDSHNGIINIGIEYTLLGIFIFIFTLYSINKIMKKYIDKELRYFFYIAFLSYIANALFHNNILVIDDYYSLILFAILAYEIKLKKEQKIEKN